MHMHASEGLRLRVHVHASEGQRSTSGIIPQGAISLVH